MDDQFVSAEIFYHNITVGDSEILFSGQQKCSPNHAYGPMARPYYLMVYVLSGKGIFRTRNTVYQLERGATFIIFPGEHVFYMADAKEPWYYFWIAFTGEYLGQMLTRATISPQHPVMLLPDNTILPELYENILIVPMDSGSYVDAKIVSLLLDILYQHIRSANNLNEARVEAVSKPASKHIDKAIEYICDHYSKNISVSDVAEYLGITREYFYSLFKYHFKVSPALFIRNYRLQCARILLLTTDLPISSIAELSGFCDYNYFSNQFRAINGSSPSKYRKEARGIYCDTRPGAQPVVVK